MGVAQLVEHQIVVLRVAGSRPVAHPKQNQRSFEISKNSERRGVAQLVAHSLWERGVVSSNLTAPTIFFRFFENILLFEVILLSRLCARSSVG